ncbi:MAG: ABC transporter ATP-binding protein, partial [Acidimicrobiia bacterium]
MADHNRPGPPMSGVQVSALKVRLEGQTVLDGVSLEVETGEFLCVVGPNGSGKTTLLRVIAGDHRGYSGTVTIGGADQISLSTAARARTRAFLSDADNTDVPFTVSVVVGFGTHTSDLNEDERAEAVDRAMQRMEIDHLADRIVGSLSAGERRRVSIARTLAQGTATLLLDEPTDALDLGHADMVMRCAAQEADRDAAVIAATHDLNLAARHADRVIVLSNGEILADGSPSEVMSEPLLSSVYHCEVRVARHPDGGPLV